MFAGKSPGQQRTGPGPESAGVHIRVPATAHGGLGTVGDHSEAPQGPMGWPGTGGACGGCGGGRWSRIKGRERVEGEAWQSCAKAAGSTESSEHTGLPHLPRAAADHTFHLPEPEFSCGAPYTPGIVMKLKRL